MNKESAFSTIENCAGFTDEATCVGEAWSFVTDYIGRLESALRMISDGRGMIKDRSTIYMNGSVPMVPKIFNMYDMRDIAAEALKD